ncbi:Lrp/AsnC family transcriptional regulator [Thermococcus sp. 2319x1]|uniref:Lrp/AsnC family transcriptional regulator n=1 Tax=Thermococcus sp. 2319x1 TaxID=1674923 RepID=UPI00158203D7|nr:Lrp/AsnC family transcriptional regulator [Thermococcus sp. 2319x1]
MLNELIYEEEIAVLKNIFKDKLDDLDIKIYQLLREDGRVSDTKIAERLGVSITTVRRRRLRLQEEGILQVMALILLKAANVAYADVLVKFKQKAKTEEIKEFISRAVSNPRIYEVTEYIGGEYDILLRFFESNPEKLKYHIDKFLRGGDIVEMYRVYLAVGSPKAWYRKFTIKF